MGYPRRERGPCVLRHLVSRRELGFSIFTGYLQLATLATNPTLKSHTLSGQAR